MPRGRGNASISDLAWVLSLSRCSADEAFTPCWHDPRNENVGDPGAVQPAGAEAPGPGAARYFSKACADPRAQPTLDADDAAACRRRLLARPCRPRRSLGAGARGTKRRARRMDVARRIGRGPARNLP